MRDLLRPLAVVTTIVALSSLLAAEADAQEGNGAGVGVHASFSYITWKKAYDADGAAQDLGGTATELPFGASFGYTLPLAINANVGITGVSTSFSPSEGDSRSGAGLREARLSLGRGFPLADFGTGYLIVGGKADIGKGPDDVDPLTELPTSNGHHAGFGHLDASLHVLDSVSLGAFGGGVYNLPAGSPERVPGLIIYGGLRAVAAISALDIWWSAELELGYTLGQASKLDGVEVEDSDFSLLHVSPSLTASTDFGTFEASLRAPTEDFTVGFALTGHNAPVTRAATLSWSHAF